MKNSTNNIFYKYLGIWVILILTIGISSIYLVEWMMTDRKDVISTDYLSDLSNFYAPIGIILSAATIILLYANFRHQQMEFAKINDMPLLIHEKLIMEERLVAFKAKFQLHSKLNYEFFMEEINTNIQNLYMNDKELDSSNYIEIFDNLIGYNIVEGVDVFHIYINELERHISIVLKLMNSEDSILGLYSSFDVYLIGLIKTLDGRFNDDQFMRMIESASSGRQQFIRDRSISLAAFLIRVNASFNLKTIVRRYESI